MGGGDFIEAALVVLFVFATLVWRPFLEPRALKLAENAIACAALLALLPVALRLALLPNHPIPTPDIYDEFSHLLVADTLSHLRLANPMHPMHRFFETFFVLQQPTYSSIYPIGQGVVLHAGRAIFGHAWAGVLLSTAAFCSLCYWMLRGWVTPGWALLGGALAVIEFGPLNPWMNNYWGGEASAAAGCLVFGAMPRLKQYGRTRDALILGLGLAFHVLTRPYETVFLLVAALSYLAPVWRRMGRLSVVTTLACMPALGITLLQNHALTGSWTTLPYALSQRQYGVPAVLTFQATPKPDHALTREQQLDYAMQSGFRGAGPETLSKFLVRLEYRVRYYRFYFLPPLYLAVIAFSTAAFHYRWIIATLFLFALGVNFFPAFQFHYVAAVVCLFILMSVAGLQRIGPAPARLIAILCFGHFLFWYGTHLAGDSALSRAMRPFETWSGINHRNPERRIAVRDELSGIPGQLLVFVRYFPQHVFQEEWVFNAADIDASRIVWARDLGPAENRLLQAYYPRRRALLLEPDRDEPQLSDYSEELPAAERPKPQPQPKPLLRFEEVK